MVINAHQADPVQIQDGLADRMGGSTQSVQLVGKQNDSNASNEEVMPQLF